MKVCSFVLVIINLLFAGCHSSKSLNNQDTFQAAYVYQSTKTENTSYPDIKKNPDILSPGYLIEIECFEDSNLSGEYRINEKGQINLAYSQILKIGGLTESEAVAEIQRSFSAYFRKAPSIKVKVKERKVYVKAQGLVNKPGLYLISETAGLDELISESQGLVNSNDGSNTARYARIQSVDKREVNIRLSELFSTGSNPVKSWLGGEVVFFQSDMPTDSIATGVDERYVNVLGQVRVPGEYAYKADTNFFYYLIQAGGPTDRADTSKILLISPDNSKAGMKVSKISMDELEKSPQIKGGDVLFVQADNPSDFQKDAGILGSLGGFFGSIATGVLAGASL